MAKGVLASVVAIVIAAMVSGCASKRVYTLNEKLTTLERVEKKKADNTYIVDSPDVLRIEVLNEPSASREATVRSDGSITLLYLEDVKVSRMTTQQIREMLEKEYQKFYKEPKILVTVTQFRSKHVYVFGEVWGHQGTFPYTGSQTVSDIIGDAGGMTYRAAWKRVKVIRGDPTHPDIFYVNMDRLLLEGDATQNVSLAENDVVRVPPTALAWVGYQLDALLFPFRNVFAAIGMGQQTGVLASGAP